MSLVSWARGLAAVTVVLSSTWALHSAFAAEAASTAKKTADAREEVELFAAMKNGDIKVEFIAKDDKGANVLIKNNTKKPLSIKLPEAFAGVPVLAQNLNNNNGGGGGGNQGVGGGFGGGGGGFGGGGGGGQQGGFFNLAPEKQGKIEVAAVCLDHGKADPNPRLKYEIVPLESYTQKQGVAEMLTLFGRGQLNQRVAQAAAWHLNNGMSWEELARKEIKHANGAREPYFAAEELMLAAKVADASVEEAKKKPAASPGEKSATLSQK